MSAPDPGGRPPVARLRGAPVEVDVRRVGQVATAIAAATVLAVAVVLFVTGARHNDQITALRQRGVRVAVTVTSCIGLLGGSGSNAAGYDCQGGYRLDGRRHHGPLPGSAFRAPGTTVEEVVVPGDPWLVATPAQVAASHASATVFVLPSALVLAAALLVGAWAVRGGGRRSARRGRSPGAGPSSTAAGTPDGRGPPRRPAR